MGDRTKIEKVISGLTILASCSKDASVCAEHDVLYAGAPGEEVPEYVAKELEALGWHYDESNESWATFT